MTLEKIANGEELTLKVAGRIDTISAKEFEEKAISGLDGVKTLIMDFAELLGLLFSL